MTTRFLPLLATFFYCFSLSAQDAPPMENKPRVWALEVYGGGGVALLSNASIGYTTTGELPDSFGENFYVLRPGISTNERSISYNVGQNTRFGVEVSRKMGLDWSLTLGVGLDYTTINGLGEFTGGDINFTGAVTDTVFFEPSGPTESLPLCEGPNPFTEELIDLSNTEFGQFGYVTVPLGARYDLPFIPLRLRAQLSLQGLVYSRFFGQDFRVEQRDNCVEFMLQERDRNPLFNPQKFTVRGALGADLRVARALHIGLQIEQQLTSSFQGEVREAGPFTSTVIQRNSFRPLNLSVMVRYGVMGE